MLLNPLIRKKKRLEAGGALIEDPELIGSTQGPEDYPIDLPQLPEPTPFDIDPEKEMSLAPLPNLVEQEDELESLPELGALAELKKHIANRPRRDQYKAGFGKTLLSGLAAALAGAASRDPEKGMRVGMEMKDRRYRQATEDWMLEGGKLKDLAAIEERSNLGKENARLRSEELGRRKEMDAESLELKKRDLERRITESKDRIEQQELNRELRKTLAQIAASASASKKTDRKAEILSKDEDDARKEYQNRTKEHDAARDSIQKIRELTKLSGSVAELGQLMSFISAIDKTAAREGEVNTQREARSLMEKIKLWQTRNIEGKSIAVTPEMRKEIIAAAEAMSTGMENSRKAIQKGYSDLASRRGYDIRNIVLDYSEDDGSDNEFENWRKRK